MKSYEKIYDQFPSETIRCNALRYLYFKIKPGAYLLPYLQEGPADEEKERER